jgi:hypothetical protein
MPDTETIILRGEAALREAERSGAMVTHLGGEKTPQAARVMLECGLDAPEYVTLTITVHKRPERCEACRSGMVSATVYVPHLDKWMCDYCAEHCAGEVPDATATD